jgi:hypothetical protein
MSEQLVLQQQLTASSHALAIKQAEHQLLASKRSQLDFLGAHAQRCERQLQDLKESIATAQVVIAEPPAQRRRLELTRECSLDNDLVLDHVISWVGADSFIFMAGVCRRWRGRYIRFCFTNSERDDDTEPEHRLKTNMIQALTSSKRFWWAMESCPPSTEFDLQEFAAGNICLFAEAVAQSIDPIKTMCHARACSRSVEFDVQFAFAAAAHNELDFLQWLVTAGCEWDAPLTIQGGMCRPSYKLL